MMMMRSRLVRLLGVTLLLAVVAKDAEAQRRCTKGIPCGGSCIAATKTCRVGAPSSEPTREPTPAQPSQPALPTQPPAARDPLANAPGSSAQSVATGGVIHGSMAEAFRMAIGWRAEVQNARPADDWLREGSVLEVRADYLVINAGGRAVRIPFTSIAYFYGSATSAATLVVVLR